MSKSLFTPYGRRTFRLVLCIYIAVTHICHGQHTAFRFIENKGQWPTEVQYVAEIPGGKMFLKTDGITYAFPDPVELASRFHHFEDENHTSSMIRSDNSIEYQRLDVNFIRSNKTPSIKASKPGKEVYNYYLGKDPNNWAEGCHGFESITYQNLYDDIDLVLYSGASGLKYDLILHKGADPGQIKFQYSGAREVDLIGSEIHTKTKFNEIIDRRPYAYELKRNGKRKKVECEYQLNDNLVSFNFLKPLNPEETVILDPELIFSTFSGSQANNFGFTACYDEAGNLYSGGNVFGQGFPATNGSSFMGITTDIGILKYDSSGTNLIYATYIGGTSEDAPHSLVVNNQNELVILGTTGSTDFPTSEDAYDKTYNGGTIFNIFGVFNQGSDIFVSKLDEQGRLSASTYIGGSGNDGILKLNSRTVNGYINELIRNYGDYLRGDVIMDHEDNLYIASSTESTDFPANSNIQSTYAGGNSDAAIFSLNRDLSELRWSTLLGGVNDDAAYSVKLDVDNNVYIGGGTTSPDLFDRINSRGLNNTHSGLVDGFIVKIDQSADSIVHSTYLGTASYDQIFFIDLDQDQNVYALGQTKGQYPVSTDVFSIPNSGQFIHKLDNSLSTTIYSTVFGSGTREPNISPTAFLVNQCDNIFLSGWGGQVNSGVRSVNTGTTFNLPVTDDALFSRTDGSDFYLMVLSADGTELLYGTYYGSTGAQFGDHVDGGTSRFDKKGIIYQSVCSCGGNTDNFPTTTGAWSTSNRAVVTGGSNGCNNAAFKFDLASLKARIGTNSPLRNDPGIKSGCIPLEIIFSNNSVGGQEFEWNFGDGITSTESVEIMHTYEEPGIYTVTLTARDDNTCTKEDIATTTISVFENNFTISDPFQICESEEVIISASGSETYVWTSPSGTVVSRESTARVAPNVTSTYSVVATDINSCVFRDSVKVTVVPQKVMDFAVIFDNNCSPEPHITFRNNSADDVQFQWDFGDGTISNEVSPIHLYDEFGNYTVTLTANAEQCVVDKTHVVPYEEFFIPNVFTPNADGKNDFFVINSPLQLHLKVYDRIGTEVLNEPNYNNDWNGGQLPSGVYYYDLKFPNGEICNSWVQILR